MKFLISCVWHLFNDHCLWLQYLGNRSNGLVNVTQSDCVTVGRGRRATIVAVAIGQFEFHTPGCNCKSKMLSLSLDSMCYRLLCLFSASVTPQAAVESQLQLSPPFYYLTTIDVLYQCNLLMSSLRVLAVVNSEAGSLWQMCWSCQSSEPFFHFLAVSN